MAEAAPEIVEAPERPGLFRRIYDAFTGRR